MALRFLNSGYFAGKVGIGTVSPSGKLEIASDSSLSSYITQYTNDADGAELVIRTARGTQTTPVRYNTNDSAGRLLFQAYTSTGAFKDAASIESVLESGNANSYAGLRFNYLPAVSPYALTEGMRLNMYGNVGIGTQNPTSKLHINQNVTNPDLDLPSSFAVEIDSNHSGSAATTGDREQGGLYIDVDSSTTGGNTGDEHRLYGIYSDVRHSGDADRATGVYSLVEQNTTAGSTAYVLGGEFIAVTDGGASAAVNTVAGVWGTVSIQDATPVINSYGGYFRNSQAVNRTGSTTSTYGLYAEVELNSDSAYTNIYGQRITIDVNTDAFTATNIYGLDFSFTGLTDIPAATNTYAINQPFDVKSYHAGNFGIGTSTPGFKLQVGTPAVLSNSTYSWPFDLTRADSSVRGFSIGVQSGGGPVALGNHNGDIILGQTFGSDANGLPEFYETMRVKHNGTATSGKVGINDTSPDFTLDVGGTFGVSDLPFNSSSVSVLVADEITGADLVTNGDFSNGETGWSFQTGWAVSNGGATVSTNGVVGRISQTLSYVANISSATKFRYRFEITNITAGSLRLFVNKPTFTEVANVNAVGVYEYDVEVSTGSNGIFYLYSTSSGGSTFQGTVTNVSVKEITPVSNQIQKRELSSGAFGDELWAVTPTDSNDIYNLNSGNVGIGTTSPTHLLNLSESDSNSVQLVIDNTNTTDAGTETSEIRFRHYRSYVPGQNDAGEIIVGKEQAWDQTDHRDSYMAFGTRKGSAAVVEKMRITSAGNVGIGTDDPQVRLTLRREDNGSLFELNRPASGVEALYGGIVGNDPYFYSNNGIFTLGIKNPDGGLGGEVSYITMRNGATRYTTFEAGNVGIGVTGPSAKLHVDSSTAFSLTSVAGDTLFLSDDTNPSALNGVGASIGFSGPQEVQRQAAISALRTGDDHDHIGLAFYTHPGTSNDETIVEQMRITHSGNVGIGTTNPGAFLQVGGTTNSNGSPGSFNIAGSYGVDSWARAYIASNTNILSILQADNTALPNGGAYRVTGHIDGTGTDQSSRAVFWNQNGTWFCNLTSASGTSSNSILFLVDATTGLPSVKTYHANDYTVRVWHERINLNEGTGTDNTRHYFGTDSYMTQINQDVSMFTPYSGNNLNGKLGVGIAVPQSKLQVAGGIQMADDTDTASATKVGTMRYRTDTEYVEVDGVELITNGDFATDTGWTKGAGWTIANGVASLTAQGASSGLGSTVMTVTSGNIYKVVIDVISTSTGFRLYDSLGVVAYGLSVGKNTFYRTVASNSYQVTPLGLSGASGSIESVSVIEVTAEDASYADMCMQTGASTYEWVNIVRNTY